LSKRGLQHAKKQYDIELNDQKIVFTYQEKFAGYSFSVYVRQNEAWLAVSHDSPFVRGKSFDLYAEAIVIQDNTVHVNGTRTALGFNGSVSYAWSGTITPDATNNWLRFQVKLILPEDLQMQMHDGYEPEIMLDMGDLPPYDRGDHVWFKINIDNPTKWNDEAQANDFPALYYFNAYSNYEVMMYFDMTAMNWMSRDNIARFLNYRCGFRRKYKPQAAYELGLHASGFSGKVFPLGEQSFDYYIQVNPRVETPTEQNALKILVDSCLALVHSASEWPKGATSWEDFSVRCAVDLMDDEACWSRGFGHEHEFIIPYVNGFSPAWEEAHAAKGNKLNYRAIPGVDAAAFIGYPLMVLNQALANPEYAVLNERILLFLKRFISKRIIDSIDAKKANREQVSGAVGCWQFIYVLEQLWQIARLNQDKEIQDYIEQEIHSVIIPLAHNTGYLFPLCFNKAACEKMGAGDNYAVGGLFANFMFQLFKATGQESYLQEAKLAMKVLMNAPVNSLPQESFLISMGVQAAALLWKETGEPFYERAYDYLLAQNIRMSYWFDDNTKEEFKDYNTLGLFQGCTPMFYPAFLENIECIARIASTFIEKAPHKGILRLFNHGRKNNFYYFPKCLPEKYHTSELKYIPLENIGVLEAERSTGSVGQEIYGCGQTFRAMLIWETYAKSENRDLMVLHLSEYQEFNRDQLEHRLEHDFIVFNPEADRIDTRLVFTTAQERYSKVILCDESGIEHGVYKLSAENQMEISLESNQFVYLKLS
jgi:hypothetical protein